MKFTKLNDDNSWLWEFDSYSLLVDPWFSPQQVDIAPWFSTQRHVTTQPVIADLPYFDAIFISHSFSDHCNKETLLQFPASTPIIAIPSILRKIKSWAYFFHLISIEQAPFEMHSYKPSGLLDLVHNAYFLKTKNASVLFAPHGTKNNKLPEAVDVLIGTSTLYKLPFWLGGTVNLGLKNLLTLAQSCHAKWILNTHDEAKLGTGVVERFANKEYVENHPQIKFLKTGESFDYIQS